MYHSVTFGSKNTWTDWHLVATSRPVIDPPSVKTRYVEIPGADGTIDLTDSLTGAPSYNDREGNMDFYVLNQYDIFGPSDYNWVDVYSEIVSYLHGKRLQMILEDDPGYYYEGRFTVDSWKTEADRSTITIGYHLDPFRYRVPPAITAESFKLGGFEYSSGDPIQITEISSNVSAITKDPAMPYNAGDKIRFSGNYRYTIAIWSQITPSKVALAYVQYSDISGGEYVFPTFTSGGTEITHGYYKPMMYKPSSPIIDSSDFDDFAAAITFLPKGVL